MKRTELWAAWLVAALLVGAVGWVGHVQRWGDGLTPASDVQRRSPASIGRPDAIADPPARPGVVPQVNRQPQSLRPRQVYVCVNAGPLRGAC